MEEIDDLEAEKMPFRLPLLKPGVRGSWIHWKELWVGRELGSLGFLEGGGKFEVRGGFVSPSCGVLKQILSDFNAHTNRLGI